MKWVEAVALGERLRQEWLQERPGQRQYWIDAQAIALTYYALAASTGQDLDSISPSQVRYRLDGQDQYLAWLCAQLQRSGHRVSHPAPPDRAMSSQEINQLRTHSLQARLQELDNGPDPRADDPVADAWRRLSHVRIDEYDDEYSDGARFLSRQRTCALWSIRKDLVDIFDRALVTDRSGWLTGTWLLDQAPVPYTDPLGVVHNHDDCAVIVHKPAWALDHQRRDLVPGGPAGYYVFYWQRTPINRFGRVRRWRCEHFDDILVPAERLAIDPQVPGGVLPDDLEHQPYL